MKLSELICDKGTKTLSIGKILLWICFFILCSYWITGIAFDRSLKTGEFISDAPGSLVTVFISLLGYIVLQKGKEIAKYSIDMKNKIFNFDADKKEIKDEMKIKE